MLPLQLSAYTLVSPLGAGNAATLNALQTGRSGLARCDFIDVDLATFIGRVSGLEDKPVRADLFSYDCRNNRLAQFALEQDDFSTAVASARKHYGRERVGVFWAPAPPAFSTPNSPIAIATLKLVRYLQASIMKALTVAIRLLISCSMRSTSPVRPWSFLPRALHPPKYSPAPHA